MSREGSVVERVIAFCRVLRERGLVVTPAESVDAVRLLEWIDLSDRIELHLALRSLLATRREDLAAFDALFAEWWRVSQQEEQRSRDRASAPKTRLGAREEAKSENAATVALSRWSSTSVVPDDDTPASLAMPSANDSRAKKDFATFDSDELGEIERLTRLIARRINARRSRRWKPARGGNSSRVDLRRTIRLSLKTGGNIVELARRERKLRRTKLVALCDVSGSMDLYSRFLLQFLYALQHAFARVETFVFSTRLVSISEILRRDEYRAALAALARSETGWSGGTKIGASIAQFATDWSRLVDRRTVVIILSDGWDTGDPTLLGDAMREIHRRAGRVLWLNPLLGSPSYKPLTRGMQAALPHVDVFAPAHNVASLAALGRHLGL
ncbi:MAG TPA: VWA domain-containing protein [Gemmatimonadaceae bacterium]|jgi:hypothetical protein